MRKLCLAVGLLLVCLCPLSAQVAMKLQLNQNAYLQFEPVFARVTFRNLSAHALAFGELKGLRGNLRFDIFHTSGKGSVRVSPINRAKMPSMIGVIIPPGGTYEAVFRVSDFYDFRKRGNYSIKAVLFHPQLKTGSLPF